MSSEFKQQELDLIKEAKETIDKSSDDLTVIVRRRIVPILLSSYDEISFPEIKEIQKILKEDGYVNTWLIDDVNTDTNFKGKYDTKFLHLLKLSEGDDYFIVPIFYFSSNSKDQRLGHHSELIDLITFFPGLIFVTGIFYLETAPMLNQIRVIPLHNHFKVHNLEEFKKQVKSFVTSYFPFVERMLLSNQDQPKTFYTLGAYYPKRGVE